MFSKYKKGVTPAPIGPLVDPSEMATLKALASRLGYHMGRVILVARRAEGWIAAYGSMSTTDWPEVFPKPLSFADIHRALTSMIAAFEPIGPNAEEDAELRELAVRVEDGDHELDYIFLAYREQRYDLTVVKYDCSVVDEWNGLSFDDTTARLTSMLPDPGWPAQDDTYIGSGRDYGTSSGFYLSSIEPKQS